MLRNSLTACLALIATLLGSSAAHAAVTMEFLAPSSQWSTAEKEGVFYVKANGGAVSGLHCWISALNPDRGDPAPRDSFTCTAPESLSASAVSQLSLKLSPGAALNRPLGHIESWRNRHNQSPDDSVLASFGRRDHHPDRYSGHKRSGSGALAGSGGDTTICAGWRREGHRARWISESIFL